MKGKLLFAAMDVFALTAFILFCNIGSAYGDKHGNWLYFVGGSLFTVLAGLAAYKLIKDING